jgi:hypothetical protein
MECQALVQRYLNASALQVNGYPDIRLRFERNEFSLRMGRLAMYGTAPLGSTRQSGCETLEEANGGTGEVQTGRRRR